MTQTRSATLLFFTESFPYDVALESTFVEPELPYLRAAFDRVVVIPAAREGTRSLAPDGVEVDETFAALREANAGRVALAWRAFRSPLVRAELAERPWVARRRRTLSRLAVTAGEAEITRLWVTEFLARNRLQASDCLAYTFWCGSTTAGLALLKSGVPDLAVISRAHGVDLYPDRFDPPYLPCRPFALRYIDRLAPDSERGVQHVGAEYPWFADRCRVARMGVADPGFVSQPSGPGRFAIVSCSRIVPIKRVDRILAAVEVLAQRRPDIEIDWHHFGDGPLRSHLEREASRSLAPNVSARFPGYSSVGALFDFYRTRPIDIFVNASESEGTPVSVMEAVSCGIPVIATAVGGNPEIVSEDNGKLIDRDASPDDLAGAMESVIDRPGTAELMRQASRRVWATKYDAAKNYAEFAGDLQALRASI